MKKRYVLIILLIIIIIGIAISIYLLNNRKEEITMNEENFTSKITIKVNEETYTATLEDNETTKEFIKMLPLEINMSELNGNEKYYYLDKSLPSNSSRVDKINNGDIMLFGSDCLVLFYDSFNTSYSYTKIGTIDNPDTLKEIVGNTSVKVSFSK